MKYLAVLGRQPEISIAELEALSGISWREIPSSDGVPNLALSRSVTPSDGAHIPLEISRLGGVMKSAVELEEKPLDYLMGLPEGKITFGVSDYSKKATKKTAITEALKLKRVLVKNGRSVRVVDNKEAVLSTATSLHNGLSGKNERKIELIKIDSDWYKVIGVQDIDAYAKRDQARPARDAKVGMLPPKLAQILINLCGPLKPGTVLLDPFCGTGVVLQEAYLMGLSPYGTDISERMVEYSKKNLNWLISEDSQFRIEVGDAINYQWGQQIDAVACEGYLGKPFSKTPTEMELKEQKQECGAIVLGFLKNLAGQIKKDTPVTIAVPAWLRDNGEYSRLDILDEIAKLGYNVNNKTREGLLYRRVGQVVARDILILRKK